MENKIKLKINGLESCVGGTVHIVNKPACVDQNCLYTGNGIIEFNVDPELCGTDDICITGFIECDSCDSCGNQEFTVCLCTENTVLTNCQTCVNGILTETCSPEELAAGKICTPNGCNCTSDKPFVNSLTGKCSVCQENSINPANKCLVCKNGDWAERDCGTGSCNPTTGECIPDCNDSNASWNATTNTCDCNPGYIKSATGCIPAPECTEDPIDQCKICVNGIIQDVVCPDPNKVCLNGDCVDPPCEGPCIDGYDCPGTNCGCGDENVCVDCATNPTALGCAPSGCSGACSDGNDCPGDDCGCLDGKCVDCSYFDCNPDLCGQIDGCNCASGTCSGDGDSTCNDKLKLEVKGCNLEAELTLDNKCQCAALSSGIYVDALRTDLGPPALSGGLGDVDDATSSDITYANFKVDIRKGLASTQAQHLALPLFTNAVINNELPESGTAVLTILSLYRDDLTGKSYTESNSYIKSFVEKSEVDFAGIIIGSTDRTSTFSGGIGSVQPIRTLLSYQLKVEVKDLEFESGCEYGVAIYEPKTERDLTTTGFVNTFGVQSSSARNPLFKWYIDGVAFRAFYAIADADGRFRDVLYGPQMLVSDTDKGKQNLETPEGNLVSLKDYKLEVDCGCEKLELVENITICDIEFEKDVQFTTSACNYQLDLANQFDVCPINQNLSFFNWGNNHASQTKYLMKVNGKLAATFIYDNGVDALVDLGTGLEWNNWTLLFSDQITSVSLEMNHDASCKVEHTVSTKLVSPKFEATCEDDGTVTYKVFNTPTFALDYVEVANKEWFFNNANFVTIPLLPKGKNTFKVVYESGCVKTIEKTDNCCETNAKIIIDDSVTGIVAGNKTGISFELQGFIGTPTVTANGIPIVGNQFIAGVGTTTLVVMDTGGCTKTASITLEEIVDTSTIAFDINPQCIGSSSNLSINTVANTVVEVSDPSGNILTGTTNSLGDLTFSGLSTAGVYTLETVGVNTIGAEVPLTIVTDVQLTGMNLSNSNDYCTGGNVQVNLSGTPYSEITLQAPGANGDLTVNLDSNGNGSTILTFPTAGNYVITSVSGSVGSCTTALNSSLNVTIETVPNILGVTFDCIPPLVGDSDVTVNVSAQAGLTVTGTVDGVESAFTATGAPNIYTATIIGGSGQSITVNATNGTGNCSDTEIVTMPSCDCVTPPNPTFNTVDGDGIEYLCDATVTLNVFNSSAGTTVKWYSDASLSNQVGTGLSYVASLAGTYYVVAENNTTGCQSNAILFSVIDGGYILTLNAPLELCETDVNQTITANISGNSVGITYRFELGGAVVQNGPSNIYLYSPSSTGTKLIEVITSRPGGECESTASKFIEVITCCTPMSISVSTDSEGCEGLTATVTGGASPYTYAWTGTGNLGTVVSQASSIFDRTVLKTGEYVNMNLVVTDDNGCEQTVATEYVNCDCLCNDLDACVQTLTTISDDDGYGTIVTTETLTAGKTFSFTLDNNGAADRFKVYENGVLLVDTTYAGNFVSNPGSFNCPINNGFDTLDLEPYTINGTDVTADINALGDGFVKAGVVVTVGVIGGSRDLRFTYTLPVDTIITIDHNDLACDSQQSFAATIECI